MEQTKFALLPVKHWLVRRRVQAGHYWSKPWVRLLLFAFVLMFIYKHTHIEIQFAWGSLKHNPKQQPYTEDPYQTETPPVSLSAPDLKPASLNPRPSQSAPPSAQAQTMAWREPKQKAWWQWLRDESSDWENQLNLANPATATGAALSAEEQAKAARFSNLGFVFNPDLAKRTDPKIVAYKQNIVQNYLNTYANVAREEARLYGIPASITLAQGLLESNAGESRLAQKEHNHFGIKCKAKCIGCRCANYTDDSRYDMFRIFDSPWHSFREHSKLLTGSRYQHLQKLSPKDYRAWAIGLKEAGYATDAKYAEKLILIIEVLKLHKYDQ